ncbi:alpha-E domain-containing protein [Chloroflexales bacterium ZM16-3]|nr:alpha-E domain-containing protein [Chloroflexales bacterium ZM16-3]
MLSRVADSLYWMSRYLERAEHTARLIAVGLDLMLDQTPQSTGIRWERLLASLHAYPPPSGSGDAYAIARMLTFEMSNDASIASCIASARENARQVREQISSEMWEQLNRLYLKVKGSSIDAIWHGDPLEFYQEVKEGAHLFQGITDATMTHGEGWQFIQVGRHLERAGGTAALVDQHFRPFLEAPADAPLALDYIDWVGLLKCCTAFEAYCKVYTADIKPESVAEFLLLNADGPRSVRFAADRIQRSMQAISQATGTRSAGRAERLAGRLRASLDYGQVDEIIAENMHTYLENIQRQCAAIHGAIYQAYVSYSVDTALTS